MGIDKHLILTLERSKNRQRTVLGGSVAMQTPIEKIRFIKGHDNKEFGDSINRIAMESDRDGFPNVKHFARGVENHIFGQSPSGACQAWNYCRILRHIAMGDEVCMVTWDDRILTLPFPIVNTIIDELQSRKEEFYLFQLRVRIGDVYQDNERICKVYPQLIENTYEYIELIERDRGMFDELLNERWIDEFDGFMKSHYSGVSVIDSPKEYVEKYIQKNRLGFDESLVLSPQGAAWLLLEAINIKEVVEPDDPEHWETIIQRRNTFDSWMIMDLDEPVKKAIEKGKGIYCPKKIGYKYVHDWLPMGSDVEWANPKNKEIDRLRNRSEKPNFLEIP